MSAKEIAEKLRPLAESDFGALGFYTSKENVLTLITANEELAAALRDCATHALNGESNNPDAAYEMFKHIENNARVALTKHGYAP